MNALRRILIETAAFASLAAAATVALQIAHLAIGATP